jgi:hypothetical protein
MTAELYGLRLRTPRVELRLPTHDEMVELRDVAHAGIHPPDEMPFGLTSASSAKTGAAPSPSRSKDSPRASTSSADESKFVALSHYL